MDVDAVLAVGGRVIRLDPRTALGKKLNVGIGAARGTFVLRMDDDDYYAEDFMESVLSGFLASRQFLCRPAIAGTPLATTFDLARWELRQSPIRVLTGAAMMMSRLDATDIQYRDVPHGEDARLKQDLAENNGEQVTIPSGFRFIQVRHGRHTWQRMGQQLIEDVLPKWESCGETPEQVLPEWALAAYREIRQGIHYPAT
ncbi:MAG: hypothetical protein NVSMB52_08360 [Chloroflexota bacterium]